MKALDMQDMQALNIPASPGFLITHFEADAMRSTIEAVIGDTLQVVTLRTVDGEAFNATAFDHVTKTRCTFAGQFCIDMRDGETFNDYAPPMGETAYRGEGVLGMFWGITHNHHTHSSAILEMIFKSIIDEYAGSVALTRI